MGKREVILETAMRLFNRDGYQAVGVDLIRDEAQVSKMTLYKYFATKDALVEAVLDLRHERFKASLLLWISHCVNPAERLRGVFNWHLRWFSSAEFHGCMFIKAMDEFHQVEQHLATARLHKVWMRELLSSTLNDIGQGKAAEQAECLQVMLDGMIVNASLFGVSASVDGLWRYACVCAGIEYAALDAPQANLQSVF